MSPNVTSEINPTPAPGLPNKPASIPASTAGMTTKVVKGSIWTLAGHVGPLAVSLIATPFVIRLLGAEGYGVWILIGLIPVYLGFADFGMCMASTRFAAGAFSRRDYAEEARSIRTALLIALSVALPLAGTVFVLSRQITEFFAVPAAYLDDASRALQVSAGTLVLGSVNNIVSTPQLTRLRMDLNTGVNSTLRIIGIIGVPVVLLSGFGLTGAATVLFATNVVAFILHGLISAKLLPDLFGFSIEKDLLPQLIRFGAGLVVANVAIVLLSNIEKGLLARIMDAEALAYYSVAFALAGTMTLFATSVSQALVPAFSRLQGDEAISRRNELYERMTRYGLVAVIPVVSLLAVAGRPFLSLWAGPEFGNESSPVFYILLAGIVFSVPALIPYVTLISSGKTGILAKLYWVELPIYIVLIYTLTTSFGIAGTALAWSLRSIVDLVALEVLASTYSRIELPLRSTLFWLSAGSVWLIAAVVLVIFSGLSVLTIGVFVLAGFVYVTAVWGKLLESNEKRWLADRIGYLTKGIRRNPV